MKTNDNKTTIKIPSFDSISVGIGTVPVSGATASNQEIEKELKKAAREFKNDPSDPEESSD